MAGGLGLICFVVILGLTAIGFAPIGIDRLFPLDRNRVGNRHRQLCSGLLYSLLGFGSLGLLLGLIFLGV